MSTDLKPCPFCGSTNLDVANANSPQNLPYAFVFCKKCGASGPDNDAPWTEEKSVANWNDRV